MGVGVLVMLTDKHEILTGETHDNTMEVKLDYTHLFLVLNNMSSQLTRINFSVTFLSVTRADNTTIMPI